MPRSPQSTFFTQQLLSGLTIAASGYSYTSPVYVAGFEGYCSCFFQITGSGTASLIYELSHDNSNWSQAAALSSLLTGFTATSGPASDGKTYITFNPPVAAWLRFKVTETGAANSITSTLSFGGI